VDVDLTAIGGQLRLLVADDGGGLDLDAVSGGRGVGNMAARARRLGGDCSLEQRPGGGTLLRWNVPVG